MARIHGRGGRLMVAIASGGTAEEIAYLNNWSLNNSTDKVDVTSFGDTNKVSVAGLPASSGSYSGFYDSAGAQLYTAALDGVARKFYLYPDRNTAATYFFGTAFFDFNLEGGVDSAVSISGDFEAASSVNKVTA